MGEVLVCVDFSETTERVMAAAIRLGAATGLTARLVHVAASESELAGYDKEAFEAATPDKRAGQLRDEHVRLAELADRLTAAGLTVVESALVMGHTAEQIVRLAQQDDAELIVVGSHGHGGLHHLMVGSVTEDLLRRSPVPVVVVPATK
jgi:nucleotide-binding universal stress UspA family protein